MMNYALVWIDTVADGPYSAGIYGHKNWVDEITGARPASFGWVVHFRAGDVPEFDDQGAIVALGRPYTPWCGANLIWQYAIDWPGPLIFSGDAGQQYELRNLDFDVANVSDPSYQPAVVRKNPRVDLPDCD